MLDQRVDRILKSKTQTSQPPLPSSSWIGTFPRNADSFASLPLLTKIKLRLLADWVVETCQPGAFAVVKINAVGHAENGEAYPQAVSLKRATAVLEELKKEIRSQTKPPIGFNLPDLSAHIKYQPTAFGRTANKRTVELVFERGQYVVPATSPFFIMELTDQVMRWAKYRYPPPQRRPPKWWKLPTVTRKDEWREIVNYIRNDTFLKYFDLKTIVEKMWDAAQSHGPLDPNASEEERQQTVDDWVEGLAEEWMEFNRDLQQRTLNPPGDPEEEPEPTISPPIRYNHLKPGSK